jgi:hypothetical protein
MMSRASSLAPLAFATFCGFEPSGSMVQIVEFLKRVQIRNAGAVRRPGAVGIASVVCDHDAIWCDIAWSRDDWIFFVVVQKVNGEFPSILQEVCCGA